MNLKKTLCMVAILFPCFIAVAEAQTRGKSGGSEVGIIIGVIVGVIVLFLACRELICWYYKINRIVALMEEQNSLLKTLIKNIQTPPRETQTLPHENEKKPEEVESSEIKEQREREQKERIKSLDDLFKDEKIMEEAKTLRRIYGKGLYVSHLKSKAKELGLGDIDLNEDDIE